MKLHTTKSLSFVVIALAAFPLASGYSQVSSAPATAAATPAPLPTDLSPTAAEVVKLAQSGVGDDVVLAYIKNSQAPYNLSANNILYLKNAGLSSPVLAAMLNHDGSVVRSTPSQNPYEQRLYAPVGQPYAAPAPVAQPAPPQPTPTPAPAVQVQQPSVVIDQTPPPPQVEIVPVAPGPDYVWGPGYWSWRGGAWIWVGGGWHVRPAPGVIWVGGHWSPHGRGYIWVGGRWR
jgi:hypothetical protein